MLPRLKSRIFFLETKNKILNIYSDRLIQYFTNSNHKTIFIFTFYLINNYKIPKLRSNPKQFLLHQQLKP